MWEALKKKMLDLFIQDYKPLPSPSSLSPHQLLYKNTTHRNSQDHHAIHQWLSAQQGFFAKILAHKDTRLKHIIPVLAQFFTLNDYKPGSVIIRSGEVPKLMSILIEGAAFSYQSDAQTTWALKRHRFMSDIALKQGEQFLTKQYAANKTGLTQADCMAALAKMGIVFELHGLEFKKYMTKGCRLQSQDINWSLPLVSNTTVICCQPCQILQIPAEIIQEVVYQLQRSKHHLYYQLLKAGFFKGVEEKLINKVLKDQFMKVCKKGESIEVTRLGGVFIVLEGVVDAITVPLPPIQKSLRKESVLKEECKKMLVNKMGPGASAGSCYFNMQYSHNMRYRAGEDSKILELNSQLLERLFPEEDPAFEIIKGNAEDERTNVEERINMSLNERTKRVLKQRKQALAISLEKKLGPDIFKNTAIRKIYERNQKIGRNVTRSHCEKRTSCRQSNPKPKPKLTLKPLSQTFEQEFSKSYYFFNIKKSKKAKACRKPVLQFSITPESKNTRDTCLHRVKHKAQLSKFPITTKLLMGGGFPLQKSLF